MGSTGMLPGHLPWLAGFGAGARAGCGPAMGGGTSSHPFGVKHCHLGQLEGLMVVVRAPWEWWGGSGVWFELDRPFPGLCSPC